MTTELEVEQLGLLSVQVDRLTAISERLAAIETAYQQWQVDGSCIVTIITKQGKVLKVHK